MRKIKYIGNIANEPHLWKAIPDLYWAQRRTVGKYFYGVAFKPNTVTHKSTFYTISQIIGEHEITIQEIGKGISLDKIVMSCDVDYINTHALNSSIDSENFTNISYFKKILRLFSDGNKDLEEILGY